MVPRRRRSAKEKYRADQYCASEPRKVELSLEPQLDEDLTSDERDIPDYVMTYMTYIRREPGDAACFVEDHHGETALHDTADELAQDIANRQAWLALLRREGVSR